jgi:tetratricopeptide (TPR) repeat protein
MEVRTSCRLEADRMVRPLSVSEWARRAWQLDEAGAPPAAPFDALAWHRRQARAGEASEDWFLAAWHLSRLIDAAPGQAGLYSRRGRALLRLGDADQAVADFSRVVESEKGSAAAWFDRGHAFLLAGEWDKAVKDLSRSLDLDPRNAVARHQRGYAQAALGRWKQAGEDLAEALNLPGCPLEALAHDAFVRLRSGDKEGYRRACRELLEHSRLLGIDTAALVAWTCAASPDGIDLRPLLDKAPFSRDVRAKPYEFQRAAAAALYRTGDHEAAVRSLQAALIEARRAGKEDTPAVWALLALAEHRRGKDPARAREWLDRAQAWAAVARQPAPDGGPTRWQRLPWPERVALEQLLREAEQLVDADARAHYDRGVAAARMGQVDDASASYRKAIEIDPKYVQAHNSLGIALEKKGRPDDALAC